MTLKQSDFSDKSVIELLQNIWCYTGIKTEKNSWDLLEILDDYTDWNFEFL